MTKIGRRGVIAGLAGISAGGLKSAATGGNSEGADRFATPAVVSSRSDLRGRDLSCADLQGQNLVGADLRGARLWGAQLQRADLRGADLRGADLWRCCLAGAQLVEADFSRATLFDARLTCADLSDARLDDAVLDGAIFYGARVRRVDFRSTKLIDPREGYRLNGTSWTSTGLSGANFSAMDLSNSSITFVDFSGANLAGVKFSSATNEGKVTRLDGVNFADADLTGADLRNVAWEYPAVFARANLTDARLSCGDADEAVQEITEYVLDDLRGPNNFGATLCRTEIGSFLHG